MKQPSSYLLGLSLTSLSLIACGSDAPPPSEVRTRIATDLVDVLAEAEAATAGGEALPGAAAMALVDRAIGTTLGTTLDGALGTGAGTTFAAPVSRIASLLAPRADLRDGSDGTSRLAADETTATDFDGEAAAQWLNDHIFTDANHAGDGVYRVPAALVCTAPTYDENGNEIGEAVDPDCVQAYGQFQLRIRVTEDDDALRFALQIGPDHDEPLAVGLTASSLSLTVDLDEAEDVMKSLMAGGGADVPAFALSGEATATLAILGTAQATLALDIDRAIAVKVAEPGASLDGDAAFRFTSAKAKVASLALDGVAKTSAFALGLGETKLHAPDDGIDGQTIDLDLPGVTANAAYAVGQPLQLSNLGLGDRTTAISINGQRAIAIDLNPDDGRALAATITHDAATGSETVAVSPKLDLRAAVNHSVLGDEAPVYDVTQVLLQGSLRGSEADARVEVVTGTFGIATNPATYGFSATAGQCVSATEAYDTPSDRYYTQWSVASCQ